MQLNKILLSMVIVLFMTSMAMAGSYKDDDPRPVSPDGVSPPPLGGQAPGVGVTGSGVPRGPSPSPRAGAAGTSSASGEGSVGAAGSGAPRGPSPSPRAGAAGTSSASGEGSVGAAGSGAPRYPSPTPHAAGVGASAVWHAKSNGGRWEVYLASESREDHIGIMKAPIDKINSADKLKAAISVWLRLQGRSVATRYLVASENSGKVLMTDETLLETIPICTEYNNGTLIVYLG